MYYLIGQKESLHKGLVWSIGRSKGSHHKHENAIVSRLLGIHIPVGEVNLGVLQVQLVDRRTDSIGTGSSNPRGLKTVKIIIEVLVEVK